MDLTFLSSQLQRMRGQFKHAEDIEDSLFVSITRYADKAVSSAAGFPSIYRHAIKLLARIHFHSPHVLREN